MEHVVFYPATDGVPSFERVNSLDEAVAFAERLRNSSGITEFSVHALTPVPVSFRAYYHVEVPETEVATSDDEVTPEPVAVTDDVPEVAEAPVDEEPAAEAVVEEPAPVEVPVAQAEPVVEEAPVEEASVEVPAVESALTLEVVPDVETIGVVPDAAEESETAEAPVLALAPLASESDESDETAIDETTTDEAGTAPQEAADEDRSAEWVAEAVVHEPSPVVVAQEEAPEPVEPIVPTVAPSPAPAMKSTPFADAPPVMAPVVEGSTPITETESGTADVVPIPQGRRSMGFFSR
jgi:hypothetical protein